MRCAAEQAASEADAGPDWGFCAECGELQCIREHQYDGMTEDERHAAWLEDYTG